VQGDGGAESVESGSKKSKFVFEGANNDKVDENKHEDDDAHMEESVAGGKQSICTGT
jgi:hypothetical protein